MTGRGKSSPASTAGSFVSKSGERSRVVVPEPVVAGDRVLVDGEPGEAFDVVGDAERGRMVVVQFDAGEIVEVPTASVVVEDIDAMGVEQLRDLLGRYTEDDFESCAETIRAFGAAGVDEPRRQADADRARAWLDRYDRMQEALFAKSPAQPARFDDDQPF